MTPCLRKSREPHNIARKARKDQTCFFAHTKTRPTRADVLDTESSLCLPQADTASIAFGIPCNANACACQNLASPLMHSTLQHRHCVCATIVLQRNVAQSGVTAIKANDSACDQTYPSCNQCSIRGLACPGVNEDQRVVIWKGIFKACHDAIPHDHNRSRSLKPSHGRNPFPVDDNDDPIIANEVLTSRRIFQSAETTLRSFLTSQFLIWGSCMPTVYSRTSNGSCFDYAVRSASLFIFANQHSDSGLSEKAELCYGSALRSLRAALASRRRGNNEELIFAIQALRMIEDISPTGVPTHSPHLRGILTLLHLREQAGYERVTPSTIEVVYGIICDSFSLLLDDPYGSAYLVKSKIVARSAPGPPTLLQMHCYSIGRLRSRLTRLNEPQEIEILAIVGKASMLDRQLDQWTAELPSDWLPHTEHASQSIEEPEHAAEFYDTIFFSKLFNAYRCARLHLHETVLSALDMLPAPLTKSSHESSALHSRKILNLMMDGICASIPYHLHRVDSTGKPTTPDARGIIGAHALVWPLSVVLRHANVESWHRKVALQTLQHIAAKSGLGKANLAVRKAIAEAETRAVGKCIGVG
ncbi:hypothetical protein AC578_8148 [Pseudocercospora eumusae]|uniref:Zn(2)-C6 fungal-type domain-containing protein n=1 Tax=Pseudocercospora eumusae TaxID=321146 RepID=A0A139HAN6_9PEZI|nr:hypothetical protein AC578_8148 [Pseudocercospora eumusae]